LQIYAINVDCQRNVRKTGMQSTALFIRDCRFTTIA